MMAKSGYTPSTSDEIDLVGQRLKGLEVLRKYDRSKCRVLNLHNNMLQDLNDLPRFIFLTELIVSSNRLQYIPDLSFLPALTQLDLSGNMIESVSSLSFLPGLKSLKVAYNCIKSLHGINGANVPNLEYLDIRENPITSSEHNIQPLSTLLYLTEVSIAKNNLQIIALLFKICPTLKYIDKKSQMVWREYAFKQKKQAQQVSKPVYEISIEAASQLTPPPPSPPPPPLHYKHHQLEIEPDSAAVATSHFDKVAAKFKRASANSEVRSAEKAAGEDGRTVRSLLYNTSGSNINSSPHHNIEQHRIPSMAVPSSSNESASYLDESAQVTIPFQDMPIEEHERLLRLQAIVTTSVERTQCYVSFNLFRAFHKIRSFGDEIRRDTTLSEERKTHLEEIELLKQTHTKAMRTMEESHQRELASVKEELSSCDLKHTSLQSQFDIMKSELEAERDKCNVLKLSNSDLRHSYTSQQEHDRRTIEDLELALQTAQAAEQRLQEKQDITLRELENALSDSSSTIEKLRLELSITKDLAMQAENRAASLQTALGALQYEKGELYAKTLQLEQKVGTEKTEMSVQLDLLREENKTLSATLAVKGKECEHWQKEYTDATHKQEKLETRLRQLHAAFEALKVDHSALKAENEDLKERENKNIHTLRTLAANVKKLQNILELRDKNCEKCIDYEEKMKKMLNERAEDLKLYERVRDSLQHSTEQLANAQAENRGNKEVISQLNRELSERTTELQNKLDSLQTRYRQLEQADSARRELLDKLQSQPVDEVEVPIHRDDNQPHSPVKLIAADGEKEEVGQLIEKNLKLQSSLHKKDAKLHECEEELHILRDRFYQQSNEFKDCMRDCAELEKRYSHAKNEHQEKMYALRERCDSLQSEVNRLNAEVARRSEVEVKLNALIADFCKEDNPELIGRTAVRKQLFPHGASISPPNTNTGHAQYAGSDGQYDSPLPCASLACLEERRALHAQLAVKTQELHDEKEQHNRLYMQKNEECARFAQALTQLESSSLTLSANLKSEQERMELTMEKYRSDKRRLSRQCESLKEELRLKESEFIKSKVAMEKLQGAIASIQQSNG